MFQDESLPNRHCFTLLRSEATAVTSEPPPPEGCPHVKRSGMLLGKFELSLLNGTTLLGVVPTLFDPLQIPPALNPLLQIYIILFIQVQP